MADRNEQNVENPKPGFFGFIRNNFIYVIMVVGIIGSVFYHKDFIYQKQQIPGEDEEGTTRLKEDAKSMFPYLTIVIICFFILYFVYDLVKNSKHFEKNARPGKKPVYASRISKDEFERQRKEVTDRELNKLFQNQKFISLSEKKGNDKKNWVWQSKEKEKKTVFRDREDSEDENERLSQITVSED
jgi:hypothetical protein